MKKYLVFTNFEYVDVPDEFGETTRFKNVLVGSFDFPQDAKNCANSTLQLFETQFSLKPTTVAERFEDSYVIIDEDAYTIFLEHYLIMPFNCNVQIKPVYCDNIEDAINDVFVSLTNYNNTYNEDE